MEASCAAFDATLARKSLISKGPSFSYCLSVKSSTDFSLQVQIEVEISRQDHDDDHSPDREQRVADSVGHCVAEGRDLTLRLVANQSERSGRGACAGNNAKGQRIVETEQVFGDVHAKHQRHCGRKGAPQEETDALRLQAADESGAGGDADDGNEDVETDRIHEPDG